MSGNASMVWHSCLIVTVTFVALTTGAIFVWIIPDKQLSAWNQSIIHRLEHLKSAPPGDVTSEEWMFVVGWTQTAFPNVFYSTDYILDADRFRSFQQELEIRLKGDVDVSTIDWIWEEFRANSRHGDTYSADFRPLPPFGPIHLDADGEPHFPHFRK